MNDTREQSAPASALHHRLGEWVKFLLIVVAVALVIDRGSRHLEYNWQWFRIPPLILHGPDGAFASGLLYGLLVTLGIVALGLPLALGAGLVTALLRLGRSMVATPLARVYLETIRNTPLLIQIYFMYFVVRPMLGLSGFVAALAALVLFEGAYMSEIVRAGIVSIHRGQWEAAQSLGLTRCQVWRYVILPQAGRRMLPALVGQSISLIKDSALVSLVAIPDLTMKARELHADLWLTFEIWFTVAAIYLVLTGGLSLVAGRLEKRLHTGVEAAQ